MAKSDETEAEKGAPEAGAGEKPEPVGRALRNFLGILFLLGFVGLLYATVKAWPERYSEYRSPPLVESAAAKSDDADASPPTPVLVEGWRNKWGHSDEMALLLLVVVMSGFGSYVHMATSFTSYVGNRKFMKSWVWWYLLRLSIGIALAVVFYSAIRGGFFAGDASTSSVSPFGFAAIAGLVGLFSKQATDKLRELFDTLFRTAPGEGDDQRKDKLSLTPIVVEELDPDSVPAKADAAVIITGQGFTEESVVLVGTTEVEAVFLSATQLEVEIGAGLLDEPGQQPVKVRIGERESNALSLTIE